MRPQTNIQEPFAIALAILESMADSIRPKIDAQEARNVARVIVEGVTESLRPQTDIPKINNIQEVRDIVLAPLKGVAHGIIGVADTLVHLDEALYAISLVVFDAANIVAASLDYTPGIHTYLLTHQKSYDDSVERMTKLGAHFKEIGVDFIHATTAKKIEVMSEFTTGLLLESEVFQAVEAVIKIPHHLKKFGTITEPPKFPVRYADDLPSTPTPWKGLNAEEVLTASGDNRYIFVITKDKKLTVAHRQLENPVFRKGFEDWYLHHHEIAELQPVYAAGEMHINEGFIYKLNNFAGHYHPKGNHLEKLIETTLVENGYENAIGRFEPFEKFVGSAAKTDRFKLSPDAMKAALAERVTEIEFKKSEVTSHAVLEPIIHNDHHDDSRSKTTNFSPETSFDALSAKILNPYKPLLQTQPTQSTTKPQVNPMRKEKAQATQPEQPEIVQTAQYFWSNFLEGTQNGFKRAEYFFRKMAGMQKEASFQPTHSDSNTQSSGNSAFETMFANLKQDPRNAAHLKTAQQNMGNIFAGQNTDAAAQAATHNVHAHMQQEFQQAQAFQQSIEQMQAHLAGDRKLSQESLRNIYNQLEDLNDAQIATHMQQENNHQRTTDLLHMQQSQYTNKLVASHNRIESRFDDLQQQQLIIGTQLYNKIVEDGQATRYEIRQEGQATRYEIRQLAKTFDQFTRDVNKSFANIQHNQMVLFNVTTEIGDALVNSTRMIREDIWYAKYDILTYLIAMDQRLDERFLMQLADIMRTQYLESYQYIMDYGQLWEPTPSDAGFVREHINRMLTWALQHAKSKAFIGERPAHYSDDFQSQKKQIQYLSEQNSFENHLNFWIGYANATLGVPFNDELVHPIVWSHAATMMLKFPSMLTNFSSNKNMQKKITEVSDEGKKVLDFLSAVKTHRPGFEILFEAYENATQHLMRQIKKEISDYSKNDIRQTWLNEMQQEEDRVKNWQLPLLDIPPENTQQHNELILVEDPDDNNSLRFLGVTVRVYCRERSVLMVETEKYQFGFQTLSSSINGGYRFAEQYCEKRGLTPQKNCGNCWEYVPITGNPTQWDKMITHYKNAMSADRVAIINRMKSIRETQAGREYIPFDLFSTNQAFDATTIVEKLTPIRGAYVQTSDGAYIAPFSVLREFLNLKEYPEYTELYAIWLLAEYLNTGRINFLIKASKGDHPMHGNPVHGEFLVEIAFVPWNAKSSIFDIAHHIPKHNVRLEKTAATCTIATRTLFSTYIEEKNAPAYPCLPRHVKGSATFAMWTQYRFGVGENINPYLDDSRVLRRAINRRNPVFIAEVITPTLEKHRVVVAKRIASKLKAHETNLLPQILTTIDASLKRLIAFVSWIFPELLRDKTVQEHIVALYDSAKIIQHLADYEKKLSGPFIHQVLEKMLLEPFAQLKTIVLKAVDNAITLRNEELLEAQYPLVQETRAWLFAMQKHYFNATKEVTAPNTYRLAYYGDDIELKKLSPAELAAQNKNGNTAAHLAVQFADIAALKKLLPLLTPCLLNIRNHRYNTVMDLAFEIENTINHQIALQLLIQANVGQCAQHIDVFLWLFDIKDAVFNYSVPLRNALTRFSVQDEACQCKNEAEANKLTVAEASFLCDAVLTSAVGTEPISMHPENLVTNITRFFDRFSRWLSGINVNDTRFLVDTSAAAPTNRTMTL